MENWKIVVSNQFKKRFNEVTFESGINDDGIIELYAFIDEIPAKQNAFIASMFKKYKVDIYSSHLLADSIALRITEK